MKWGVDGDDCDESVGCVGSNDSRDQACVSNAVHREWGPPPVHS